MKRRRPDSSSLFQATQYKEVPAGLEEEESTTETAESAENNLNGVSSVGSAGSVVNEKEDPVKGPLDRNDVKGLIRCGSTTAKEIRAILERHLPDLQKELDEILA